ncbi:MAG TPA: phosphatase PAP2 family protein [Ramlibacter sp.]|nr:phosphatase PAP2 family protein [Ramlibacter sp.]
MESANASAGLSDALKLFKRDQPVGWPLVALLLLMPFYVVIGWEFVPGQVQNTPATPLDAMFALSPQWSVVYGSLFLAALLPAFVLHDALLFRRTILAYLVVWVSAIAFFLAYPTLCPRPLRLEGDGYFVWLLRVIYGSDHRYNCFPSLHVAQCFIAALACRIVNRRLGDVLLVWAALVALSTVFTKQHYVADAVAGTVLAFVACAIMFRDLRSASIAPVLRQLAPALAATAFAVYASFVLFLWMIYKSA